MNRNCPMNRSWTIGLCLTLLLIGGVALDASAQQPPAPATPPSAESRPPAPDSSAPGGTPQTQPPQMQQAPNVQTETRTETERIVEREPGKFLGVDPTVAMIVGAVLLIVIVFALVAMGRRRDEIHHTHHTQPRI
jgi:hypothetical protein